MKPFRKLSIVLSVLVFNLILGTSIAQHNHTNYCEEIRNQPSSLNPNSSLSSLLRSLTLCRSQKLYFRTSLGLFQVTSVDYNSRLLTISHSSCSSPLQYLPPLAVTAGFPSPPESNSLLLFNCSSRRDSISPFKQNFRGLYKCGAAACSSSRIQEQEKKPYLCLIINDLQQFDKGFHPKHLNCSHYSWVHRSSSDIGSYEGYKSGSKISFDIPNHVPDLCKACAKPDGNCGAGLKCLCHAKECKDKVLSKGGSINSVGKVLFALLSIIGIMAIFMDI